MKNARKACAFVLGAALFAPVLASAQNNNMNGMNMPAQNGQVAPAKPSAHKKVVHHAHKVSKKAKGKKVAGMPKGKAHHKMANKMHKKMAKHVKAKAKVQKQPAPAVGATQTPAQ